MKFKGIEFDEIVDVYDTHGLHDKEVEILGYDKNGVEYAAVAMESCGEIVEIYEDTIEKITMKSPDRVLGDA
jgi:hypothetical protein